jgi:hypothetical protein
MHTPLDTRDAYLVGVTHVWVSAWTGSSGGVSACGPVWALAQSACITLVEKEWAECERVIGHPVVDTASAISVYCVLLSRWLPLARPRKYVLVDLQTMIIEKTCVHTYPRAGLTPAPPHCFSQVQKCLCRLMNMNKEHTGRSMHLAASVGIFANKVRVPKCSAISAVPSRWNC